MMMRKALHPSDDEDRLYVSRKKKKKDPPTINIAWMQQYNVTANWLKSLNGTLFSHVWRRGGLALDPLQK